MLAELEDKIGHKFKSQKLLEEALTHPSTKKDSKTKISYERMEFLGDKVLSLVIADFLFKKFPEETEGEISKRHAFIVCGDSCFKVAEGISLGKYLVLSHGQEAEGGRKNAKILENVMEAIIGAIYLDYGFSTAQNAVLKLFHEVILNFEKAVPQDSKSKLQEIMQKKFKKTPKYELLGQDENKDFMVSVEVGGKVYAASAKSIKAAEKQAAEMALKNFSIKS